MAKSLQSSFSLLVAFSIGNKKRVKKEIESQYKLLYGGERRVGAEEIFDGSVSSSERE